MLIAQTISQLRADAAEDGALVKSLTTVLNGSSKPDFLDEINITEINLGEEFPIFSNCRVIPVDENGMPIKELRGDRGERLQARMDVDLGDVLTLGIETKLVLNYPKPFVAVLPVALAVSVVRFSGTLSLSFSPSSMLSPAKDSTNDSPTSTPKADGIPEPTHSPTTLTFTFLDDYRLDLSVHSLIGSRSKLQDVPKIAQLIEDGIHAWFDGRCVEPRFQQIVLPSLWPRKKTTRGGEEAEGAAATTATSTTAAAVEAVVNANLDDVVTPKKNAYNPAAELSPAELSAEQRTRDWAARHGKGTDSTRSTPKKPQHMSEIELAGHELREAEAQDRRRTVLQRQRTDHERQNSDGLRQRTNVVAG